ncbi:MAG: hypothetical protein AAGG75_12750 [Bacteroidota bacterium]
MKKQRHELEKFIELYQSLHLAEIHLQKINERLTQYYMDLEELSAVLTEQSEDLDKLVKMGLFKLFSKVLGDPQSRYEQKKQAYLLSILKFNECKKMVELLEFEKTILDEKLQQKEEISARLNQLIKEEEEFLTTKYPSTKDLLTKISKTLFENITYKKELMEAITVCIQLKARLEDMIDQLKSAKEYENWGAFYKEIQEGKAIKRSYIDQAQKISYEVKQLYQQLQDEMEDSYRFKTILKGTDFKELKNFNKVYNTKLVADWLSKEEIHHALSYVRKLFYSLRTTLEILETQQFKTEEYMDYLHQKQKELLFEANDQ